MDIYTYTPYCQLYHVPWVCIPSRVHTSFPGKGVLPRENTYIYWIKAASRRGYYISILDALGDPGKYGRLPIGSFKLRHGQCTIMGMDHHACAKCNAPDSPMYQHNFIYDFRVCDQCWYKFQQSDQYSLWNLMVSQGGRELAEKVATDWFKP